MKKSKLNQSLKIILCLAGTGQRFLNAGYKIPKFLLAARLKRLTILDVIIENLSLSGVQDFFLILNIKHKKWENEIKKLSLKFKNFHFYYFFIHETSGQAETAYRGVKLIQKKKLINKFDPIAFHNGDTILFNRNFNSILKRLSKDCDGAIDTFPAYSNAYSYIKTFDDGTVKDIQEKNIISKMASTGLYLFKNQEVFESFYKSTVFVNNEKYISEIYQTMIKHKLKILSFHNNKKVNTLILGTPSAYECWLKND